MVWVKSSTLKGWDRRPSWASQHNAVSKDKNNPQTRKTHHQESRKCKGRDSRRWTCDTPPRGWILGVYKELLEFNISRIISGILKSLPHIYTKPVSIFRICHVNYLIFEIRSLSTKPKLSVYLKLASTSSSSHPFLLPMGWGYICGPSCWVHTCRFPTCTLWNVPLWSENWYLWGLVFPVNLMGFRIPRKGCLWVCLWESFGMPTLTVGGTIPWSGVLE